MDELTHASFFSGVGGLDLGLERAGWRTVSFSEIDPYASAVLAQRWPGVPNLGDIVQLASRFGSGAVDEPRDGAGTQHEPDTGDLADGRRIGQQREPAGHLGPAGASDDQQLVGWDAASRAHLWTGGFPCQDLSVAGKRRGMVAGTRSNLAYSFLALAERYRPRFVLLENVPGLLSSHGGRDMAALIGALVELGYGVGYRVLDARYFGVPQRRRRVFILGDSLGGRAGAERASEVLSVGSRCWRHPPTGIEAGSGVAGGFGAGVGQPLHDDTFVGPIDGAMGHHGVATPQQSFNMGHIRLSARPADDARGQGRRRQGTAAVGGHEPDDGHQSDPDAVRWAERASSDPGRVRAADGLAGRLDDRGGVDVGSYHQRDRVYAEVAPPIDAYGDTPSDAPIVWTKTHNDTGASGETWESGREARSMNGFDGDRTALVTGTVADDPLLPLGLDSHRYRCCGNGVVADVSEWIGARLAVIA